ncbi:hypothetical protein HID58_061567 [Brassica napus]|uniref:F-box protein At3g26010-like beta-propeller domain-containing protein n=1 Tax=Brassica napus TaxID=3708 RepID=A0ABQ7ZZV2_BRANA|nr:hypothetical protein HID58_061567 [Brassica napus]
MSHYGSGSWNLTRSLGSFISSFLKEKFENRQGRIVAYTDVGLVLIHVVTSQSFYVANPVSRQCVEILPRVPLEKCFWILEIATRTKDGVVLGYKVVLFISQELVNPISLSGSIHWLAHNHEHQDFVVSFDFYATGIGHSSHPCHATTPFPDLDKNPKLRRACTTSQGFLMYMNVVSVPNRFCYIPLGINPFDAKKGYFWKWNQRRRCFLSVDLHNGEFVLHKELKRSAREMEYLLEAHFPPSFSNNGCIRFRIRWE